MAVMSECPTCGKVLNTLRGMRQHHTKVHGESLPNRTCRGCGEGFYDPKADRAFCEDCNAQEGEHNGNWQDAKERTQCKLCNDEFDYYPSDKKGTYCPDCIEQADGLLPEGPDLRVDRVDIDCIGCGKALTVLPSELRRKTYGKFCSLDCYGEWLSENVVGENHHQWEGGTIPYGEGWWTVRRKPESGTITLAKSAPPRRILPNENWMYIISRLSGILPSQATHTP